MTSSEIAHLHTVANNIVSLAMSDSPSVIYFISVAEKLLKPTQLEFLKSLVISIIYKSTNETIH